MALAGRQITLVADTATDVIAATNLTTKYGTVQDPLPIIIRNADDTSVVKIGGSDVDGTHGLSIKPGESLPMALYGDAEKPWVWSSGTPVVEVLAGRQ